MTDPVLAVSTSHGRFYKDPNSFKQVPSITNIIGTLDKPALMYWAAKCCAEYAAQNLEALTLMKTEKERIDVIKGAPRRSTGDSSEIGSQVHDWIDQYIKHCIGNNAGKSGPDVWRPEDLADAKITARRMWGQALYLMCHYRIEWLHSELTVWSDTHDYAGTGDAVARIGGKTVLLDWKCMVPETLVTMSDGVEKRAGDIHHGDMVSAWDENAECIVPARVVSSGDNGTHPVVTIRTICGRKLVVTEEHPVMTSEGWKKAADIRAGDMVRVAGAVPASDASMSDDDAYLIGVVLGDGGLSHHAVNITTLDPAIVEFLREYGSARGLRLSVDSEITYRLVSAAGKLTRNPIVSMFRSMGLMGTLSGSKFVPDDVLRGGRNAWLHCIAGYLDTDGYTRTANAGGWNVSWDTKSEQMATQFQSMLTGLGVRSRVIRLTRQYKGKERIYWRLIVGDRNSVRKLQSLLPVRGARTTLLSQQEIPELSGRSAHMAEDPAFDEVTYASIERNSPTVWIEVAGLHTHLTGGIVTHNTGKGVYGEVSLQLAALANADYAIDGNGSKFEIPAIDRFAVGHVRPTFTRLSPVTNIPEAFQGFLGLRAAFNWKCNYAESAIQEAPKIQSPGTPPERSGK